MGANLERQLAEIWAQQGDANITLPASVPAGITAPTPKPGEEPAPLFDIRPSHAAVILVGAVPVPLMQVLGNVDTLEDLGALGGSCSSRQVRHRSSGSDWAVKRRPNNEQCVNEEAVNRIYSAFGAQVPYTFIIVDGNSAYLVQRMVEGKTWKALKQESVPSSCLTAVRREMGKHFVLDCLFANWDVVGARGGDNILIDSSGATFRIDNAGVLGLRAQGGPKYAHGWGPAVTEIFLMRDASSDGNESAGDMFKDVSDEDVAEQIRDLLTRAGSAFSHLAPVDRAVVASRIDWLKEWLDNHNGSPSAPSSESLEVGISQLVSLGFERDASTAAMIACNGDAEAALLQLTAVSASSGDSDVSSLQAIKRARNEPPEVVLQLEVDAESIAQLTAMGFDKASSESALAASGGDVGQAVSILTS